MRLLIDSPALIWFCEGNPALSAVARQAMEDGGNERFISHATPPNRLLGKKKGRSPIIFTGER